MTKKIGLNRFVGHYVDTNQRIPSDRRGEWIPCNTTLFVREMVGAEHYNLDWPGGLRAASQVHYTKLMISSVLL